MSKSLVILLAFATAFVVTLSFQPKRSALAAPTASLTPAQKSSLAKCLTKKGVKLYGTAWCHYCKLQKEAFGPAAKDLPYIQCNVIIGEPLAPVCQQAGIDSFPTWILPDGRRIVGYIGDNDLPALAETAHCPLN